MAGNNTNYPSLYFPPDLADTNSSSPKMIIKFSRFQYKSGGYSQKSAGAPTDANNIDTEHRGDVYLPIPAIPKASYSAGWENGSMMLAAGLFGEQYAQANKDGKGDISAIWNAAIGAVENLSLGQAKDYLKANVLMLYKQANDKIYNSLTSLGSQIAVPYEEILFKGIGFRGFNFNFKLAARNYKEIIYIRSIVEFFKTGMLPAVSKEAQNNTTIGPRIFLYPDTFLIKYKVLANPSGMSESNNQILINNINAVDPTTGKPKPDIVDSLGFKDIAYLNKFQPCCLESCTVDYSSDSPNYYTGFGPANSNDNSDASNLDAFGAPTVVDIGLQFKELAYVTSELAQDGY